METPAKQTTVYLDPIIYKALKLKSIETSKSISELVNMAVKAALFEDAEDLAAFEQRADGDLIRYDEIMSLTKENDAEGIKLSDIEFAFDYVSSMPMACNSAVLCKNSGDFFYSSDYDDEDEIPEDVYDREDCVWIPHKNELDLGRNLVFEFAEQHLPDDIEHVRQIFRKKGAYARYKDYLDSKGFLKKWYDYENKRQTETITQWCKENKIILSR
jgi:hypothetical protein